MKSPDEVEWNEEQSEALAAMSREAEPDWRLEERVVARLRREGLVRDPQGSRWRRLFPLPLGWAAAAAAFVAAVFLAGISVGQHWATRSTADALASFHEDSLMRASARVQRTGSAYVAALAALGQLAATTPPQELSQGREAAASALYAAASQLSRLDPDDPVAIRLLQGLEDSQSPGPDESDESTPRRVLWF